jgi:hypothetical protein
MTDTTIIEREVDVVPAIAPDASHTPFSWSAAIAGAFAATAVTFIVVALGSGIGLSFASPYGSGPSATSLTIAAAVWLVMAQSLGFATGGYLAGRLRSPAYDGVLQETTFRDAAQGLMVWAIGVVAMAAIAGLTGLYAAGAAVQATAGTAPGMARTPSSEMAGTTAGAGGTDYFVDLLLRPGPAAAATVGAAPAGAAALPAGQAAPSAETRAEVTRILVRSVGQGRLDDEDRMYLAQVVSARTGLGPDEAQRRVAEVETKARDTIRETADKAAKAGAYFSFWMFMSLLFGAAAATLAGILGGQLRDGEGLGERA